MLWTLGVMYKNVMQYTKGHLESSNPHPDRKVMAEDFLCDSTLPL